MYRYLCIYSQPFSFLCSRKSTRFISIFPYYHSHFCAAFQQIGERTNPEAKEEDLTKMQVEKTERWRNDTGPRVLNMYINAS